MGSGERRSRTGQGWGGSSPVESRREGGLAEGAQNRARVLGGARVGRKPPGRDTGGSGRSGTPYGPVLQHWNQTSNAERVVGCSLQM